MGFSSMRFGRSPPTLREPRLKLAGDAVRHVFQRQDQNDSEHQHVEALVFAEQKRKYGREGGAEHHSADGAHPAHREHDDQPDRQVKRKGVG